jgi:hypothetical protein
MERYRVQEWLNFITSELLKTFGPMFRPATSEEFKKTSVPPGHAGRVQEDFCSARPRRKSSRRLRANILRNALTGSTIGLPASNT